MLNTPPLPIPDPRLAQRPVAELLAHFATVAPWLSDAFGLVQTGVDKTGKNRYPQIYPQDGGRELINIQPDEKMKGLLFFERDGPSRIKWNDELHMSGTWAHPLAVVVWLNLPLIGSPDAEASEFDPAEFSGEEFQAEAAPPVGYDFSDQLAEQFLYEGLLNSPLGPYLEPDQIEQRAELIFQRYRFPQERQQLLMYPYAGFRIPFVVRERFMLCPARPAALPEPTIYNAVFTPA